MAVKCNAGDLWTVGRKRRRMLGRNVLSGSCIFQGFKVCIYHLSAFCLVGPHSERDFFGEFNFCIDFACMAYKGGRKQQCS